MEQPSQPNFELNEEDIAQFVSIVEYTRDQVKQPHIKGVFSALISAINIPEIHKGRKIGLYFVPEKSYQIKQILVNRGMAKANPINLKHQIAEGVITDCNKGNISVYVGVKNEVFEITIFLPRNLSIADLDEAKMRDLIYKANIISNTLNNRLQPTNIQEIQTECKMLSDEATFE